MKHTYNQIKNEIKLAKAIEENNFNLFLKRFKTNPASTISPIWISEIKIKELKKRTSKILENDENLKSDIIKFSLIHLKNKEGTKIIKYLINNINFINQSGDNNILFSISDMEYAEEIIKFLISKKLISINDKDSDGLNFLSFYTLCSFEKSFLKTLINISFNLGLKQDEKNIKEFKNNIIKNLNASEKEKNNIFIKYMNKLNKNKFIKELKT